MDAQGSVGIPLVKTANHHGLDVTPHRTRETLERIWAVKVMPLPRWRMGWTQEVWLSSRRWTLTMIRFVIVDLQAPLTLNPDIYFVKMLYILLLMEKTAIWLAHSSGSEVLIFGNSSIQPLLPKQRQGCYSTRQ